MRSGERVLQGREPECQEIDEFVDGVAANVGASLILTGETGVGKTALLRYVARRASGVRVLAARGVRAEMELPFAGLHSLLGPVLGFLPRIPSRQAAALSAGLALSPGTNDDGFAVAAGTLNLLSAAAAAQNGPLLVLVDDLHMWDATSRQALLFVARRAANEDVAMVLSSGEEEQDPVESGVRCHRVPPLDPAASRALLEQVSPTPVAPMVAEQLVLAAAGVPLALIELPHVLTAAQLAGAAPLPDPLPMGARVRRAFAPRLSGLEAPERAALVVAAAAGEIDLGRTHDALEAMGIPAVALEAAEASGVVRLDGDGVSFHHPLVRAVAYHEATLAERRAAHRALAGVTPQATRARHLGSAALGPDEQTADELERIASGPGGDLLVSEAARLMERAAELTGGGLSRAWRCIRAAELWQLAGRSGLAVELLVQAAHLTDDVRVRAQARALLARTESMRGRPTQAHRSLVREAARVRGADPGAAAAMLLDAVSAYCLAGDVRAAMVAVRRACLAASQAPAPLPSVCAAMHAVVLARCGQLAQARDVLGGCRTGVEAAVLDGDVPIGWRRALRVELPGLLTRLGEFDTAGRMLDEATLQARALAADGFLPALLWTRAELALRLGDWDGAHAAAIESLRLADQADQVADAAPALIVLARLAAARGLEAECSQRLARAREIVGGCRLGGRCHRSRGPVFNEGQSISRANCALTQPVVTRGPSVCTIRHQRRSHGRLCGVQAPSSRMTPSGMGDSRSTTRALADARART